METYNGIIIPNIVRTDRISSAFANSIDNNKIDKYSYIMHVEGTNHNFPPILGFPDIITEDDLENEDFGMLDFNSNYGVGDLYWKVTDGHHRSLAAIQAGLPHLEVNLDYSCITKEEEL